ncbi:hypothetical protein RHA1_ro00771 [Rhodococcus jostii RHA1]|uniref:Uncharacterized protein n=1 Tax=Rhodococcus jostii (strain RHA1) TaxID=101510 RepID=Q0SIN0_RHOJR|nr:hypothetical protein RHA1_ro00771 [Rhodococcus jostii RHA1]
MRTGIDAASTSRASPARITRTSSALYTCAPAHENLERTRPCPRSYEFSPDLADRRRDRRDDPDRLAQHQPRADGAGQHRHAVPSSSGDVRSAGGAAHQ